MERGGGGGCAKLKADGLKKDKRGRRETSGRCTRSRAERRAKEQSAAEQIDIRAKHQKLELFLFLFPPCSLLFLGSPQPLHKLSQKEASQKRRLNHVPSVPSAAGPTPITLSLSLSRFSANYFHLTSPPSPRLLAVVMRLSLLLLHSCGWLRVNA